MKPSAPHWSVNLRHPTLRPPEPNDQARNADMDGSEVEDRLPIPSADPVSAGATFTFGGPDLAVVIPTFNERENIAALVQRLDEALKGILWEVIFVDDNSPDGTIDVTRQIGRQDHRVRGLLRLGRRGLAGACVEGLLASNAPYLAVMDADLQHNPQRLPGMLELVSTGLADVVVGSRYMRGGSVGDFQAARRLASRLSTLLAVHLTAVKITDPMSGFFVIRREAFQRVAPSLASEGFKILLDILASARGGLRVVEIPYVFGARTVGSSKLDLRNVLDFVGLLVSKFSKGRIPLRFASFMLVGSVGVLVHMAALRLGLLVGAAFAHAQLAATIVAMTSNFWLNNAITYRDMRLRGVDALKGLFVFYAICGMGALSNVGVAAWLYANEPVWWMAGLAGSVLGAAWNYMISSQMLWRRKTGCRPPLLPSAVNIRSNSGGDVAAP